MLWLDHWCVYAEDIMTVALALCVVEDQEDQDVTLRYIEAVSFDLDRFI